MRERAVGAGEGPSVRLRDGVGFCLLVFVLARLVVAMIGVTLVEDQPPMESAGFPTNVDVDAVSAGWHNAVDGTYRWDAAWFVKVAATGYDPSDGSAEFYPAYPLLTRTVAAVLSIGTVGAAILVANLCFLMALIVLYALTTREYEESTARRTVVLFVAFPASLIFFAPYSESLFLLASVATFLAARADRWPAAAVAGFVATASRAVGVILVPSLVIEALAENGRTSRRVRVACAVLPVLGILGYLLYWQIRAGDPTIPLRAHALWDRTTQFPPWMLGSAIVLGILGSVDPAGIAWTSDLVLTAVVVVPLVIGWRLLRPAYLTYASLSLLAFLVVGYAPRPLLAAPRYAAVLFPAFWVLAIRLGRRGFVLAVVLFAVAYVIVAAVFMNQRTYVL